MSDDVRAAFELETVTVPLDRILPTKQLPDALPTLPRYQAIAASVAELGVIEPLVVFPQREAPGTWLLLDGHVRLVVLRERGATDARCLVATDDEGYTYNHKVSRLAPIQECRMVFKALAAGVAEERIARALNMSLAAVRSRRTLLNGVREEVLALLKDRPIAPSTLPLFKRVVPSRQLEMAELMIAAANFTRGYAKALVATTPAEELTDAERAKREARGRPDDLARLERQLRTLERDMLRLQTTYGTNVMNLTLAHGFLRKLLDSRRVAACLAQHHGELLAEIQRLLRATSLEE